MDGVCLNIETNTIHISISDGELEKRSQEWSEPKPNYKSGALAKYAFLVGSAAKGATTDPSNYFDYKTQKDEYYTNNLKSHEID